eukprot:TRINITY_DN3021_c0_g1_i6.p1 TRINITY_DN3021_c0_g1~~TRINITY_DN3021_c0_g1_i6.p1  ORF type:complete len:1113 (-),score=533.61 TRINITY_DN3021_c0_g1_i6:18-3356(-)
MFGKSSKGEKIKADFSITVHYIKDLPKDCVGNDIFIECKRGSKSENHATTKKISAPKDCTVKWEEKLKFHVTLLQNAKTGKFDEKKELAFNIKEEKEVKGKKEAVAIGKATLNLAEFSAHGTIKIESLAVTPSKDRKTKEKRNPTLMVKIETQWLKVNNQVLVKKSDGGKSDAPSVKIGNEQFELRPTDEITETSANNVSDNESEGEDFKDDDDKSVASKAEDRKSLKSPISEKDRKKLEDKQRDALLAPSTTPSKTTTTTTKQVTSAPSDAELELGDLKRDNERLQKRITRLTEQLEEEKKKKAAAPSGGDPGEIEDLQRDKARLEKRVDKLTKDNEDLKAKAESAKSSEDNTELEDLQRDKARLEKKVEKLTKDLEDVKKEAESSKPANGKIGASSFDQRRIDNLEKEKKELQTNLDAAKESEASLTEKNKKLQKDLDTLKSQKDDRPKSPAVDDKKVAELQAKLETEMKEKQSLKGSLDQLIAKEQDARRELVRIKEKKKKFKKELEELKKANEDKPLSKSKSGDRDLEDQISKQKQEIEKYKQRIQTLEDEALKSSKNMKTTSSRDRDDSKLQTEVENLKKKLKEQEIEKEEIEEQSSGLKEQVKELEDKVEELEREVKKAKDKKDKLQDQLDEAEERVKKAEEKAVTKSVSFDSPKLKASQDSAGETKKLQAEIDSLKKQLKEVDNLKKEVSKLQTALDESQEESQKSKDKVNKLKEKLDAKESELDSLQGQLKQSKSSNDGNDEQLKKKIQDMRQGKEADNLKKKINILQKENQERRAIAEIIYEAEPEYDEDRDIPAGVQTLVNNLLSWNTLEDSDEDFLSSIVSATKKSFAKSAYDSEMLAYWLSFTSSLFRTLKDELPSSVDVDLDRLQSEDLVDSDELDDMDPPNRFFHQLLSMTFDIYSLLVINLYSQLDNILTSAILDADNPEAARKGTTDFPAVMSDVIKLLKNHHVAEPLLKHVVTQLFFFIDAQVFNSLLSRQELFKCSAGFKIKMAISKIEAALGKVDKHLFGNHLNHIKEAANLLIMDKSIVSDEETVANIFSHLNIKQIKQIVVSFVPDDYAPDPVPDNVKRALESAASKPSNYDLPVEIDHMKIKSLNIGAEL